MPKTRFNWKGITDNGDGTYTAASRIEKRRLLKSLHGSGYSIRSTQQADGTWKVAAIGSLTERHRRSPASGYKMKTRYNRQTGGRYVPVAKRKPGRYVGGPQPIIVGGGTSSGVIPRGPSVYENFMRNRKARKVQRETERKQMLETDAKMKKERIEAETQQQREETARTIRKEEFAREKARFEHTRLQQERDAKAKAEREQRRALYDNPTKPHVVPRQTPPMHLPPRAQRPAEPYIKPPHVEKVPKVDPLALQSEREREVSGG